MFNHEQIGVHALDDALADTGALDQHLAGDIQIANQVVVFVDGLVVIVAQVAPSELIGARWQQNDVGIRRLVGHGHGIAQRAMLVALAVVAIGFGCDQQRGRMHARGAG